MIENIKVGDFLRYKGHNIRNMFATHYDYPVAAVDNEKKLLHFVNGYGLHFAETVAGVCWELSKKITVKRHSHPCTQVVNVSDLKAGDYFRFWGKKSVYLVDNTAARGFVCYSNTNNVWGSYQDISKKSKRLVEIGFEF